MKEKKVFTYQEIKQKMVNYCVYQDRCHQEVERKMEEFVLIPEARDEILLYLIQERFLDEERFTRSYIRGKFYIKHWGKIKISLHLKQKGITEKLMNKCMDEIQEEDYIQQIYVYLEKLLFLPEKVNNPQEKKKAISFLLRKGYEYEKILNVINNLLCI